MGGQSDNFPQAKERVRSRIRTRIRSSVVKSHAHIHYAMLSFFSGHLPPSLVEGNRQRSSQSLIIITLQGKALIGGHINNLYHHLGDTQYCMFKESKFIKRNPALDFKFPSCPSCSVFILSGIILTRGLLICTSNRWGLT